MKSAPVPTRQVRAVISNYLKDKAARLFNSAVAMIFLIMAQNGMAWHFQGVVWNDVNQDGIYQTNEPGVSNVTVNVLNCTNNAVVFTTTTASDGSFTVTDSQVPLNGDYAVAFTNLPAGYVFTQQIYPPPTNGAIVSTVNPLTGIAPCFVFNQPTNNTLNNAGIVPATVLSNFCLAVLAKQSITLSGNMLIDSFNSLDPNQSTIGLYDSSKRGDDGNIASIASGVSVITDTGNTSIYGHFFTGPSGAVTISGSASVGSIAWVESDDRGIQPGWYSNYFVATIPDAKLPAIGFTALKQTSGTVNGTNYNYVLTNGNYKAATLTLSGSARMCINGAVVLYLTNGLTVSGQAYIYLAPGANLTLYLGSSSTISGQGMVNGTSRAANCSLIGLPACTSIQNSGNSEFIGTIYAPEASVSLTGGGSTTDNFAGSVVANSVTISGAYRFHYDQALCNNCGTPVVTVQPSSQSACLGTSATFTAVATNSDLTFQWYQGTTALPAQTNSTLVLTNITAATAGAYNVVVMTACGNSVTNSATLALNIDTTATPLSDQTVCPGGLAAFSTAASGTGPFTYVWRLNGVQLPGQTAHSITILPATAANAGTYSIEVYGSCNSVTNTAILTVSSNTLATPLVTQKVCPGSPATFSTTASGTGPFSYIWRFNGAQIGGQTTNSITIPAASSASAGTYSVEVYGNCNSVTNTAALTLSTNTTATPLTGQTVCPGSLAIFSTIASGTGPFAYVWRFNGAQLIGQTANTITIPSANSTNAGIYAVEVYGNCNSVTNSATLTISTNTAATALTPQTVCPGSPATFSTVASGTGPFSYIWRLNGIQLTNQTTNTITIPSVGATNVGTYSVEVYGNCDSVTNSAALATSTNTAATPLTSVVLCPGSPATFTTIASGSGPFLYVWRFNGAQLTSQTSNSISIPSISATNAGAYSVEVYGGCNSVTNTATLTISTNTTATAMTSLTLCPASPAMFSTIPSGTGPFSYVWRLNGTQLPGESTNSLTIPSVTSTDAGTYTVEVYGSCNSVTNSATLTLNSPTIATPLTNLTVCPGSSYTFMTAVVGTGPFSYIWRLNGMELPGQTTNTLQVLSATSTNAGTYSVEVHGNCNSVTNSALVTVSSDVTSTPLTNLVACPGTPAMFATTPSGSGPFSYVWRLNGAQLSSQTTNTLSIPSVSSVDAGTYSVEVYGACNSVTNSATLTVSTNISATALTSPTACPGSPVIFTTTASGTGPFSYVWRFNGTQLPGQTTNTLNLASVNSTNAGTYSVEVYGSCNSVTNSATLTISTNTTAAPLAPQTVCPGDSANFATIASGTGPFAYIWRLNGVQLPGQTTNTLLIPSVNSTNAGLYSVEVYGNCNSVTNTAPLTISTNVAATALTNQTICPGSAVAFATIPSGTGPFTYVWRLNGTQLTGQSANSLIIPSASFTDAGTYAVEVYASCGSVTNSAMLTVNTNTSATPLTSLLKPAGGSAMFSTTASGTGPSTYVWRFNGTRLIGQTNNSLSIASVGSTNVGTYSVEIYGDCNSVTNSATLTLATPPTVTILSPTNGSTFIALANITVLAGVQDLDSIVTNVTFFAATNAPGTTNIPGIASICVATNVIGATTSGPPYFILWTNVTPGVYYIAARGVDTLGAVGFSQIVTVKVIDQPPVVQNGSIQFNPQIDEFVQTVSVTNPTYYTYTSVRVLIGNLAPGVQVVNASGVTNGVPFVQSLLPIPPGGSVTFTLDYYVPFRIPPSNMVFTVQLASPLNALNEVGPMQHITRSLLLPDKTYLVDFKTLPNRVYYIQFSSDLKNWSTAIPAITGTGGEFDWIDSGPPETPTPPSVETRRFYRVILLP